jgi:hypothetical protein
MFKKKFKKESRFMSKQTTILLCKNCISEINLSRGEYECPICGPLS